MIKTLAQLGEKITEGRDPWASVIQDKLKITDKVKLYVVEILFDLDDSTVKINTELSAYSDDFDYLKRIIFLKTMGRNIKRPYLTVEPKKLAGAYIALFGKADKKGNLPIEGDLCFLVKNEVAESEERNAFVDILNQIFNLKSQFDELFLKDNKIDSKVLDETISLTKTEKIGLIKFFIKSEVNNFSNKPLHSFDAYRQLIENNYLPKIENQEDSKANKLCYVSGELRPSVKTVSFTERYNINKMFVQETKNFASNFSNKNFSKNYQVSEQNQLYINAGSNYLLNNLTISIAEVRHAIIPEFINSKKISVDLLKQVASINELIFGLTEYEKLNAFVKRKSIEEVYWITFLNIDSDGNYFKTSSIIRNVSSQHILKIITNITAINKMLKPWLGDKYVFNLYSVYKQIPVRKDLKTNNALKLIATILENRNVDFKIIYKSFVDVILCYWFERYGAYKNIRTQEIDFGFKDAVFIYTGLFQLLNNLKNNKTMTKEEIKKLKEDESSFLESLAYTKSQKALFYLGRALNDTAYAQERKGNKRAILDKINFNGMDKRSIYQLSSALFEKGTQYNQVNKQRPLLDKIQYDLAKFNKNFDINKWEMNPHESLFFILSGYTYGIKSKGKNEQNPKSSNPKIETK